MGRTSNASTRLLEAASALIHSRGYAGIGVAEICAQADVRKGSFYHFFESKQALTVEVIESYWARNRSDWSARLQGDGPALTRLEALIQDQIDAQRVCRAEKGVINGCLLGNLAAELSSQDEVVQAHLQKVFDEQIELIETVLHEAAAEGDIPAGNATTATARAVVAQLEGMVLLAKLANSPDVLGDLWRQILLLLQPTDRAVMVSGSDEIR